MAADPTFNCKIQERNGGDLLAVASGGAIDIESGGELRIAGTAVTATAAELNAIAGNGLSAAELAVLDGVVAGTTSASKALVVDANKALDVLALPVSGLKIGAGAGTAVDRTAAQLNLLAQGVAAGYKIARGVAAVTGTGTVATGLATVVAVIATPQSDPDGVALAAVSATIGDQAGAPAAGSVILKAWKVTATNNATLIAATAAQNINWFAIGT